MEKNFPQIQLKRFGKASSSFQIILKETEQYTRNLGDDEVLIDVHYSALNFADIVMRLGFYPASPKIPFVPGYEVSGIVRGIGKAVQNFKTGDRVYSGSCFGGYQSILKVPEYMVHPLPPHLNLKQATGVFAAFITAHTALYLQAGVRKNQKILIDCATGGVGLIAIELLKSKGCRIVGLTGSSSKLKILEQKGIKALTHDKFKTSREEKNFDIILNSQGGKSIDLHYQRLSRLGKIVCIGVSSGIDGKKRNYIKILKAFMQTPKYSFLKLSKYSNGVFALDCNDLMNDKKWMIENYHHFELIDKLKITPEVGKVFSYKDIATAHHFFENREAKGKVLLDWNKK
jgi:NADPH:quinone reductase-like Zn-dependent oxidoreductase